MKLLSLLVASSAFALPAATTSTEFDRFFYIVLENRNYDKVVAQKYMQSLISRGLLLTNMHGVAHPSQPNYVAMISGSTRGVALNFDATITDRPTIVDTMEKVGKTWKAYQEEYPGDCFTGSKSGTYVREHNSFISFPAISGNPARCAKIVNSDQLYRDIQAKQVPEYVFYTPDQNNNGHDTDVNYAAARLEGFIEPLLANPYFSKTLFVVTFDENEAFLGVVDAKKNQIATALLGPGIAPGSQDDQFYDHYSFIRFLQKRWKMKSLGENDQLATTFEL